MAGRTLAGFRPPIDRKQMQVRRKFKVAEPTYVVPDNWWDACVWALHEWTRFKLVLPGGGEPIISATFWDVEPLGHNWGVQTVGLVKLDDTPEAREAGLTTYPCWPKHCGNFNRPAMPSSRRKPRRPTCRCGRSSPSWA